MGEKPKEEPRLKRILHRSHSMLVASWRCYTPQSLVDFHGIRLVQNLLQKCVQPWDFNKNENASGSP